MRASALSTPVEFLQIGIESLADFRMLAPKGDHRLKVSELGAACRFRGTRYDCGSKLGYLQAMVAFGCKHPEVGEAFDAYLKEFSRRA